MQEILHYRQTTQIIEKAKIEKRKKKAKPIPFIVQFIMDMGCKYSIDVVEEDKIIKACKEKSERLVYKHVIKPKKILNRKIQKARRRTPLEKRYHFNPVSARIRKAQETIQQREILKIAHR